jgi:predicted lipoprotein with Yx(FWY)xxD motif
VKTATIARVTVLTSSKGLTLYSFAPDTPTTSKCNGTCDIAHRQATSGARHSSTSARETSGIRPSAAGSRSWPLVRERASHPRKNSL